MLLSCLLLSVLLSCLLLAVLLSCLLLAMLLSCLLLAMLLSCLLLAMLLSCLLLAMLFRFFFIFSCCWACSSRGPRSRVAFFLLLTTDSLAVDPSLIPFTTGSLAVFLPLFPPASLCGSLRLRGSLLSPPTSLLSIEPLRDCWFAADALVPRIGSLHQRVLLTMRIGFSFARYFFFACSAELSVSLCTGCVHPHEVRVFIAASDSGQPSHTRYRRLLRCVGWCASIRTAVSCDRSSCAAVSLAHTALLCAVVLLCLLHGCAGVPTSLNSVATSFEASCERPSLRYTVY